jgi:hypothetical protein
VQDWQIPTTEQIFAMREAAVLAQQQAEKLQKRAILLGYNVGHSVAIEGRQQCWARDFFCGVAMGPEPKPNLLVLPSGPRLAPYGSSGGCSAEFSRQSERCRTAARAT